MDHEYEPPKCPNCGCALDLEKDVSRFTCPWCERRYEVRQGDGARAFVEIGGDCALSALGVILLVLAILILLAGGSRA